MPDQPKPANDRRLHRTRHPGIYRRGDRYVVVWRHRGRQTKSFHRTLVEAREAKGRAATGDSRPRARDRFDAYADRWLDTYRGRTARGLAERTRRTYRRDFDRWVIPYFSGWRLDEVEPPDVRDFVGHLESAGLRPASIRAIVAPLRAMYATAVEDGTVRMNPTRGVRVGTRRKPDDDDGRRAMTRTELRALLRQIDPDSRLLFEVLAQTGLRISEAIGLRWGTSSSARPR
jgi:integrase